MKKTLFHIAMLLGLTTSHLDAQNSLQQKLLASDSPEYIYRVSEWVISEQQDHKVVEYSQKFRLKITSSNDQHTQLKVIAGNYQMSALLENSSIAQSSGHLTTCCPEMPIYSYQSAEVQSKFWRFGVMSISKGIFEKAQNSLFEKTLDGNSCSVALQYNFKKLFSGFENALSHGLYFLNNPSAFEKEASRASSSITFQQKDSYPAYHNTPESNFTSTAIYDLDNPWNFFFLRSHSCTVDEQEHFILEILSPVQNS